MARLSRIKQIIFGSTGLTSTAGFGGPAAGTLTTEVATSNTIANIMSTAAWAAGWLSATLGGSKFPVLEDLNSVGYVLSTQLAYILQTGIPEYDSASTYFTNNIVLNPGTYQLYGSVTNNNTGNLLSDAVNWKLLVDLSTIATGNSFYNGGTSTGSANAQVCASPSPSGFALTNGFTLTFIAGFTNSGAATMNANSTGATAIYKNSGAGPVALTGNEITAGNTVSITYNSTISKYVITNSGGLLAANNLSDVANAATALGNLSGASTATTITAAGMATGGGSLAANRTITVTAAVAADERTATSNAVVVTPGTQKYHPSACKAWVSFTGSTGAILASFNVSSVTRNSTGDYTVNFTNAMLDGNYVPILNAGGGASTNSCASIKAGSTPGTGSFEFVVTNVTASPVQVDEVYVYAAVFGNQ